jgi:hypothetical protein
MGAKLTGLAVLAVVLCVWNWMLVVCTVPNFAFDVCLIVNGSSRDFCPRCFRRMISYGLGIDTPVSPPRSVGTFGFDICLDAVAISFAVRLESFPLNLRFGQ